jgi:membrane protein
MATTPRVLSTVQKLAELGRTAAEMAFYFALSFVPFLGLTVSVAVTWLPRQVGEPLATALVGAFPAESGLDPAAITRWAASARRSGWLAAGVLLAAWSSFRFMTAGVHALAELGGADRWSWGHRLRSIGSAILLTVLWMLVLLTVAFVLLAVPGLRETLIEGGWIGHDVRIATLARVLALGVLLLALVATYRLIPGLGARGARLWIGAGIATVGWIGVVEVVRRLLPRFWGQQSLYGALGSFVLFLLWSWANAWVILAGGLLAGRKRRATP